jgi:hypothetical protein
MKFSKFLLPAFCGVIALTLTGCGVNPGVNSQSVAAPGAAISGIAHGGNFPVASARVDLWYPGVSGYGSTPTSLAHVTTASDGTGSFSFPASSYTCPASDMPVYLTVTGGNPGLGSTGNWTSSSGNSYAALMAYLGPCSSASSLTGIIVNEVTTVAAVFATAQFTSAAQAANGKSAVNTYTVSSGGSSIATSTATVTFSGGGCSTEPTAAAMPVTGNAVAIGTFNTATFGIGCTSAPTVTILGTDSSGTGIVATASYSAPGASGSVGGTAIGSVSATATSANGGNIGAPIGTISGSPGVLTVTNQLAYTDLKNAFALANNLANIYYGESVAPNSNTVVPSGKINTIADILADCIQSDGLALDGSQCPTIAADVTPASRTAPIDTVQIAEYMALAPYTNVSTLFGFVSGQPIYSALSAAPFDWTLTLTYSNLGIVQASTTTGEAMAADTSGNIWALGAGTGGYSMVGISPLGQSLNGGAAFLTGTSTPPISTVQAIMVDSIGSVWTSNKSATQNDLVSFNPNTLSATTYIENAQGSTGCGGSGLTMDSGLNILYTCALVTSPDFPLNGFQNTGTLLSPVYTSGSSQTFGNPPANTGTSTYPSMTQSDAAGNIWTPNYIGTSCSVNEDLPNVNPQFGTPTSYTSQAIAPSVAGGSNPIGLAIDHNGVVWFACSTGFNHIPYGSTAGSTGVHVSGTGQMNSGKYLAVDGAGDVWIANGTANAVTGTYAGSYYSLSEYSNSGANLTPCWETETSCQLNPPGGIAVFAASTGYAYPLPVGIARYLTIDGSGNVWASNFNANSGNVVEVVGAAVPVFTPLAVAASQNRIGTLP